LGGRTRLEFGTIGNRIEIESNHCDSRFSGVICNKKSSNDRCCRLPEKHRFEIFSKEGDYALEVKGNQVLLHQAVQEYFMHHTENNFATTVVQNHQKEFKRHVS
jgi:hypothetical protein